MTQEALKLALEALLHAHHEDEAHPRTLEAITAIKEALAQTQEPVAWRTFDGEGGYEYRSYEDNESYADEWNKRNPNHKGWVDELYTHSQRTWVGLTDDEIAQGCKESWVTEQAFQSAVWWAEEKLKEKNT